MNEMQGCPDSGYPIRCMTVLGTRIEDCALVAPAHPAPGLKHALEKFIGYIEKATGTALPMYTPDTAPDRTLILVGQTGMETPAVLETRGRAGKEGYVLLADSGRLYITGATERGTIYGLYAFLEEQVGWRFLASGCQVIHPADEVKIPDDIAITDTPYFESRDLLWYDSMKDPDQTNALRLNGTFMRDMKTHGGGMVYGGGFVHTLATLAEMENPAVGDQPCLTDEKVFETVRRNVRKILKENPDVNIVSVSQNDSYAEQLGCQCARCRAIDEREGTPMGSLLTFVNRVADDIREDYPDVLIDTLAYRYTRKAPKTIKPADNVIIRLCSIECCFSHPIADGSCERNVAFCKDIQAWSAICDRLYIWDYTTNYLYYLTPFPNLGVLRENVQFFKEHHVRGMFEQGNYQSVSGEFGELRAYLLAHLLWNPDMTKEQYEGMMDGFLADYYGPGWKHIRRYIDWTTANAARRHLSIYDDVNSIVPPFDEEGAPCDRIHEELLSLWDQALDAAVTAEQRAHVEKSRLAARYQYQCVTFESGEGDITEGNRALVDGIRACGITHWREGAIIPDEVDLSKSPRNW